MGMVLNIGKTEALVFGTVGNLTTAEGGEIKKVTVAQYLECKLNNRGDGARELSGRIAECMATLKRLDLFWGQSTCTKQFKLQVFNAVIRSKLVYGLESIQLNETALTKMNVFQLKGLRQIMVMKRRM